jgi:hypothetical protein
MAVIAGLDARDLMGITGNPTGTLGAINEDMMQKIWDISRIPLPFYDRVGRGRITAPVYDWVTDRLVAANGANKWVDSASYSTTTASGVVDYADSATVPTIKYRNHAQIMVKAISVSELAQSVSSVGGSGGLEYNLIVAQKELRRDMEARLIGNYASVASVAATTAGETASYIAGCKDQTVPTRNLVDTAGTEGGYNTSTFVFDALTVGTARGITEAKIRDLAQALYLGGCGGPDQNLVGMCDPTLKRTVSGYFYTSTAKVASLLKDVGSASQATAQGSVEYFITDFGTVELVPNRFMGDLGTNQYAFFLFDPSYFEIVYIRDVTVTENAKIGLMDRRTANVYWGTRFNPECMGVIADINPATAMTA